MAKFDSGDIEKSVVRVTGSDQISATSVGPQINDVFADDAKLSRGLKQRHIQMIALAGAIGTGLFLSIGGSLAKTGPVGLLIAYLVVGFDVCCTQVVICEVSTLMPVTGSYIRHAAHFVDPALGFAIGWNRVYQSLIGGPGEIVAAAVLFDYWSNVNSAVWITVCIVLLILSNLGPVKFYGEVEFWLSVLKIILILGLILVGLIIDLGGTSTPRLGFHYWRDPGPFAEFIKTGSLGKFIGFWSVLSSAVYAYGGVNEISVVAGETQDPRHNIPKACKRIFVRILIFYIVLLFIVTLVVPYNDPKIANSSGNASSSPMVIAIQRAGIRVLPHIINAVVITSAWSAANSGVIGGSRTLYSLSAMGYAPKIFLKTNRWNVPWVALATKLIFFLLAYMSVSNTAATVFSWFQNLTSSSLLVDWIIMSIDHIYMDKALKAQGYSRSELPWSTKFAPFAGWFALIANIILLLTGGFTVFIKGHWNFGNFFSAYFSIPMIVICYIAGKIYLRSSIHDPKEVDLESLFEDVRNNPENVPKPKGWQRVNFLWG